MSLEDEAETIELRPHHIEVFLRKARKEIEREVAFDYSQELANKVMDLYGRANAGIKVKVVPAIDDICQLCRKICPDQEDFYCSIPDTTETGINNSNDIAEQLNLREGMEYSFDELQAMEREYQAGLRQRMEELKRGGE